MLILLAILILGPFRPDLTLTPGVVRPLTTAQVCGTVWSKDHRYVTLAMKRAVFRRYGVPWEKRALYEVDHLIPRSEGGADAIENLWAQPWDGPLGAHAKDREEHRLHRAVCAGAVTLETAQAQMRNWGR